MKVTLSHLTKKFPGRGRGSKKKEDVIAVNDFDFTLPDGKLVRSEERRVGKEC